MIDTSRPILGMLEKMGGIKEGQEEKAEPLTPKERADVDELLVKMEKFLDDFVSECQKNDHTISEEKYCENMWKKQKETGAYPTIYDPVVKNKDRQEFAKQHSLLAKFKQENISWLGEHEGPIPFGKLETYLQYHAYMGSTPHEEYIKSYVEQKTKG